MCRSRWKLPFISLVFFRKSFLDYNYYNTFIRNSLITNIFIDKRLRVYNGSKFISFIITSNMIGKKLGEFSISKVLGSDIALSKSRKAKIKKLLKKKKK